MAAEVRAETPPTLARIIFATLVVVLTVVLVWKVIDYRMRPPPPPHPVGAPSASNSPPPVSPGP